MSGAIPAVVNTTITPGGLTVHSTDALDAAIEVAKDFAGFVSFVERTDPAFAAHIAGWLTSQSLLGAKTVWVPPLIAGITFVTGLFLPAGLLDPTAIGIVAFALAFGGVVFGRLVAKFPITRVFPASWTNAPAIVVPKLPTPPSAT